MALRQEQVVLGATTALLGVLLWRGAEASVRTPRGRGGEGPQMQRFGAPDLERARPWERQARGAVGRDLFAPPRDTQPLPPLALEAPPLPAIAALEPPGSPGPQAAAFGRVLRAPVQTNVVPGLFAVQEEAGETDDALDGEDTAKLLAAAATVDEKSLTPDERAARLESWKKLYDWMRVDAGEPLFGRIVNEDRFGLPQRPKDALQFVQVDPKTGLERFPGMKPVSYERARVLEYELADTPSNFIQLRRREFQSVMSAGRYADLLAFADRCVELRLEARDALGVAEEMYRLAGEHAQGDPAPRLGLARCHEAAFEFEAAYEDYLGLLQEFGHRAEVHVGMAMLEARFRLFESVEERLREAERIERLSWRVQWAFGEFLLGRGRAQEALGHLEQAFKLEPADPLEKGVRADIRTALGRAHLALGDLEHARDLFERALQADAGCEAARAGQVAVRRLMHAPAAGSAADGGLAEFDQAGFEWIHSSALEALDAGQAERAKALLELSLEADPLRAAEVYGALSWLAETCGYPEESFRFIEQAVDADPDSPWILYQRGRCLAARDDPAGARDAFLAALDREVDFVDALVQLGLLARQGGDLAASDKYLERALSIDPARPEVHALRGLGLLELGDVNAADAEFGAALTLDDEQPTAQVGRAWVAYRRGEGERAVRLFAELDDRRRALPEDDPYRAYCAAQIARIQDHATKELWVDRFERRELRNNWTAEESAGPLASLDGGALVLKGEFKENGSARVWREYAAPDFLSIEIALEVRPENNARVGLFVAKERRRGGGETEVQGIVAVARRKDGGLVVRTEDRTAAEPLWTDVPPMDGAAWWPAGQSVRLRIERVGEGSAATGKILVNGVPVAEGFAMRALSSSTNPVRVGVFSDGQTGLPTSLAVQDVSVVYRVPAQ